MKIDKSKEKLFNAMDHRLRRPRVFFFQKFETFGFGQTN